jgi:hypothetical protein
MNIPQELFGCWLNSLIEAVRECDPAFDADVEKAWRTLGQEVIDYFIECIRGSTGARR